MDERLTEALSLGIALEIIRFFAQTLNPLQCQPGMHRIGATADQAGDVVFEARHAGIGHEADLWTQAARLRSGARC